MEELLKLERERRSAETEELRNLLYQEREKAIEAAREAERSITEIRLYKKQAHKAEQEAERCRLEVQQVKEHSIRMEGERNKGSDLVSERYELRMKELREQHQNELSSL